MTDVKTVSALELETKISLRLPPLFRSFWIAGFECSCQINSHGRRLDMTAALRHDVLASRTTPCCNALGIRTARDGVRWHLVDRGGGRYDFSSFAPMVKAAREHGIQVIWDLCHYGWPDDLDLFSATFLDRFGAIRRGCRSLREGGDRRAADFAPVNEINFFAWAATRDLMYPYAYGRDGELKRQLVRAATVSAAAILNVDPQRAAGVSRPMIHNVPPRASPT